jgi:hypothetical protein
MKSGHMQQNGQSGGHSVKLNKPGTERQIEHALSHIWKLKNVYLNMEE